MLAQIFLEHLERQALQVEILNFHCCASTMTWLLTNAGHKARLQDVRLMLAVLLIFDTRQESDGS